MRVDVQATWMSHLTSLASAAVLIEFHIQINGCFFLNIIAFNSESTEYLKVVVG